jgi:hypothetical protein
LSYYYYYEDMDDHSGGGLQSITGGLVDLMKVKIGHQRFFTYVMGQTRIDYALATPRVVTACTNAGYEPFQYRFETDHRVFSMDFDNSVLFGNATPTLASPPSRTLFSQCTKQRTTYDNSRWLYLVQYNWFDRLQKAMSS